MANALRKSNISRELDRNTWSSQTVIVIRYETIGSGSFLTPELGFGVRFSGPPYVSFGPETSEVGSLVEGDYPHVTVGVAEWVVKSSGEDAIARGVIEEHIGAKLWISVTSETAYAITHSLQFKGLAMKTPLVEPS
jgi:hypothetical protein